MKKFLATCILLLTVCAAIGQNQTIVITESDLPYYSQSWFCSGSGGALQESKIKSAWDEGKRITSAAHTNNGWLVTMAKGTGIGMQTYSLTSEWPSDWIKSKWDEKYYITSISRSASQWLVVMSKDVGITNQTWNRTDWSSMAKWIKEKWDEGLYITSAAYNGTYWTVVMSKDPKYTSQGYMWATNEDSMNSKLNEKVKAKGQGNKLQLIECGGGEFFIVYCQYRNNNGRSQKYKLNPSDLSDFIQGRWESSQSIAYVGGGYLSSSYSSQSRPTTTTTARPNSPSSSKHSWREELGAGMFAINQGDPNGPRARTIYRTCVACRGSSLCGSCSGMKKCAMCNGYGGIVTSAYGTYIPCAACGQTGHCPMCGGTGKCVCYNYDYPGYMPSSTVIVDASGQVLYNSHDYGSLSSPSNRRYGKCSKCNGRKYESTPYKYAAASASGARAVYHHSDGSTCPFCNWTSDHYHYPCTECMQLRR